MNNGLSLNVFQKTLRGRLIKEMALLDKSLLNLVVTGKKQAYISAEVEDTLIKIWIYKDGAEFTDSESIDNRYEEIDYESLDQLIEIFVHDLKNIIVLTP